MEFAKFKRNTTEAIKAGIIPGVVSTFIFLLLFFLHFLWKFYLFQNIPWTLFIAIIGLIGASIVIGPLQGAFMGVIYSNISKIFPESRWKKSFTFSILITGIFSPIIVWQLIWSKFIILYLFLSLLVWTSLRLTLRENLETSKLEKSSKILAVSSVIVLISLGSLFIWFEWKNPLPDELLGSSPIGGAVGNSSLTVGFTKNGRISVLSWPSPSYYDQVDYLTKSRNQEYYGAAPQMGVFGGIYFETGKNSGMRWFWEKNWKHEQYYLNDSSNVFITRSTDDNLGLEVTTQNFVLPENDILVRNYEITKNKDSSIENLVFYSYANFCPNSERVPLLPISNHLQSSPIYQIIPFLKQNKYAYYFENSVLFTEKPKEQNNEYGFNNTVIGMSYDSTTKNFQIGSLNKNTPKNAFTQSESGKLTNSAFAKGKVNAAISKNIENLEKGKSKITLYYTAANSIENTLKLLKNAKNKPYTEQLNKTENWWNNWLQKAKLPNTSNKRVLKIAKRSLISIRNAYDKKTGAIVASISRQPPYHLDWSRDGAFINYALDQAGFHKMVEKHNKFYVDSQRATGTWGMNYYADGTEGGPLLFEIDETGLSIWTMWKHYEMTENLAYLENIYPSMKNATNFLYNWKDPNSNLHFYAHEDDNPLLTQTLNGAVPVYLGLKSGIKAGKIIGEKQEILDRWEKRANNLRKDIEDKLWKPEKGKIVGKGDPWLIWPGKLQGFETPKMKSQANLLWNEIFEQMNTKTVGKGGSYESISILALSKMWAGDNENMSKVKDSVEWLAENVATENTAYFGEFHQLIRKEDELVWKNRVSVPHVWNHALFYSCAMEAYVENKENNSF